LRLEGGDARLALGGTAAALRIERNGTVQEWPAWRAVDLQDGDIVSVTPFADTAVAYFAVTGGFDLPEHFGSRSTFLRGGFGGLDGKPLKTGGTLKLVAHALPDAPCQTLLRPPVFAAAPVLRALPGPQADYFTPE